MQDNVPIGFYGFMQWSLCVFMLLEATVLLLRVLLSPRPVGSFDGYPGTVDG